MKRKKREDVFPSLEECNDLIDWLLEHNDIDLNVVRITIRETEDWAAHYIVTVNWLGRSLADPPQSHELLVKSGWVIESWRWNGECWLTGIWRAFVEDD